jgi:hypothetical protein
MPSRERRREERRKRKARSAERRTEIAGRYEERNREARESLEPLREDERPVVVTVAAVIATLITGLSVAGWALWDVLRDDPRPNAGGVVIFVGIIGTMAYGLWRARYWAVLGFQATLVIVILAATLGAISALTVGLAIGNFLVLVIAGTLFWHMVKALARIQMPERR